MASYNDHPGDGLITTLITVPPISKELGESEAHGEINEDDILYQMDQELDQRLDLLRKLRTRQTPTSVARSVGPGAKPRSFPQEFDDTQSNFVHETCESLSTLSIKDQSWARGNCSIDTMAKENARDTEAQEGTQSREDEGCSPRNLNSTLQSGSSDVRQGQLNGMVDEPEENVKAEAELLVNETEEDEAGEAKEEGVFDEFLDHSTRLRIGMLTKKVATLSEALKLTQEECKRLSQAKRTVSTAAQVAEKERRNMNKQVQTLQQELSKLQKFSKHSQQRVKELTGECQALRKELSSTRQSVCERRNAQSSHEAQLTRSRADNAALRDQLTNLKIRHKEEVDELRVSIESSNSRVKELERQQRNFSALVKKQEKLITILNEQKNNVAAAKAMAGLEEKFLAVISPLQPP